jgi:hypothetical protein
MSWLITGRQVDAADPDALAYLAVVEAADTQALEPAVRLAVDAFVIGCKADGIWSAIKASCILAGARTLTGALVPLVGTAPTNNNFVSGDYNRKTGLVGDGSTKYLNSNRNNNADPQDNNHNAVYITQSPSPGQTTAYMGVGLTAINGSNQLTQSAINQNLITRSRQTTSDTVSNSTPITGLLGFSRPTSSQYSVRVLNTSMTVAIASQTPFSSSVQIFAREGGINSNARLSFYSIGEALDLALLGARVTALINALDAAI